jgi:phosphoglycerate dehydrogenase-like enzyme
VYVVATGSCLEITSDAQVSTILRSSSPWSPPGVSVSARNLDVLEYLHTARDDRKEWLPPPANGPLRRVGPSAIFGSRAVRGRLDTRGVGATVNAKLVMLPPQREETRAWAARLRAAVPEVEVVLAETDADAREAIGDADAAFGTIAPDVLARARKLRWLQAPAAAPPAGYYYPALIAHPVVVTNFREIFNDHIGAHIMALVLAFARGFHYYLPQQLRREWSPRPLDTGVVHLSEATALIVGVGGIGSEAARLAAAFGMRVVGIDARRTDRPPGVVELHRPDALDRLLPEADFVILTVPHTPETEGLMHRARFRLMKRSAFFINIGRGMTVRLADLVAALRAGELAGAGLDVFEIEPLPADHPLWTTPGVLLTPHTAGYGPYLDERRLEILIDNCRRFAAGQPLRNVVDKASWY